MGIYKTLKNINSIAQVEYEFGKELPKDYKRSNYRI